MKLEKGVYEVKYKNKGDRAHTVKYRVFVNRKDLKVDKLFDDPEEANQHALFVRSKKYAEQLEEEKEEMRQQLQEARHLLQNPVLVQLLKESLTSRTHLSSYATDKVRLESTIPNTIINLPKGMSAEHVRYIKNNPILKDTYVKNDTDDRKFGQIQIHEITPAVVELYIEARREKNIARATIKKELGLIAQALDDVPIKFKHLAEQYKVNPARLSRQRLNKLLPPEIIRDEKRLSQTEEEKVFARLRQFRNPAMLDIGLLSLATGMRRTEVLTLKWPQVDFDKRTILLNNTHTKSKKQRLVPLTDLAFDVAKRVKARQEFEKKYDPQGRLFLYTVDGFNSNWQRAREELGIDGLKFHLLRHEFITRLNEQQNINVHMLSKVTGMTDVRHLEKKVITGAKQKKAVQAILSGNATTEDVMHAVGHADTRINANYTHLNDEAVIERITQPQKPMSKEEMMEQMKKLQEMQQQLMEQMMKS